LLFGLHAPAAGALFFDMAWLASLIPLRRAGLLSARDLGLRTAPAARSAGLALLVLAASFLFDGLWRAAFGLGPTSSPFSGIAGKSTAMVVITGVAAVVSPVVEELFFRGLLYRSFRNRLPVVLASGAIGAMFGLVHTEYALLVLPELTVYGALLCLLYEYTGSLLPGIALNLYLDASGFEQALTGSSAIVFWSFVALAFALILRSRLRFASAPAK
jgi:membrane protease YdiL (CAAX protease family)